MKGGPLRQNQSSFICSIIELNAAGSAFMSRSFKSRLNFRAAISSLPTMDEIPVIIESILTTTKAAAAGIPVMTSGATAIAPPISTPVAGRARPAHPQPSKAKSRRQLGKKF